MHLRLWLTFAAVLTTTTGCPSDPAVIESGDDDGDDDDSADDESGATEPTTGPEPEPEPEPVTEVPLADFFAKAEEAVCTWQVGCHAFGGVGRCQSVMHLENRLAISDLAGAGSTDPLTPGYVEAAVAIGRIEYDEVAAVTCLNYVAARSCDVAAFHVWTEEELAGRDACQQVFKGTMGKNGPCNTALECAEEAICGFNPMCTDMCCPGACRVLAPPIALGEACGANPNTDCEDGTYCGVNATCEALPTVGQNCDIPFECADASFCEYNDNSGSYECKARAEEGDSCEYYLDCAAGLTCVLDEDYEGTCTRPAGEGEPCKISQFNPDEGCLRVDNYCDPVTLTCTLLPGKAESCEYSDCRGDFFCVESAGYKCSPVADEGEACGYNGSEYVPCSGDSECQYNDNSETCMAPSATQCPPPEDPLGG